jgi:hypothetical protein
MRDRLDGAASDAMLDGQTPGQFGCGDFGLCLDLGDQEDLEGSQLPVPPALGFGGLASHARPRGAEV